MARFNKWFKIPKAKRRIKIDIEINRKIWFIWLGYQRWESIDGFCTTFYYKHCHISGTMPHFKHGHGAGKHVEYG